MMASEGSVGQISVDSVDISDYDKYQDITHYKQSSHTVNIDFAGWAATGSVTTYSPDDIQTRGVYFIPIFVQTPTSHFTGENLKNNGFDLSQIG